MRISWISDSGIRLETSQGLIMYNHTPDVLTPSSQKDENTILIFSGENEKEVCSPKILDNSKSIYEAGEYEIHGIPIQAFPVKINKDEVNEPSLVYSLTAEGMNICIVNNINNISIPAAVSESMGKIDILCLLADPNSENTIESVNSLVSQLDPSILAPVEVSSSSDVTQIYPKLTKELGQAVEDPISRASVSKSGLQDALKVLNLKKLID